MHNGTTTAMSLRGQGKDFSEQRKASTLKRPLAMRPLLAAPSSKELAIATTSGLTAPYTIAAFAHVNPPLKTEEEVEKDAHYENTNLCTKLADDFAIAGAVTFLAAPFLTVVDQSLVQRSSGMHSSLCGAAIENSFTLVHQPLRYLRSPAFFWMWDTYAATYTAANSLRTLTEHQEHAKQQQHSGSTTLTTTTSPIVSNATTLFVGTTLVNCGASLVKDRAYAQMFGGQTTATAVPATSYTVWMVRDLTAIGSSFVLPPYVARYLQREIILGQTRAASVAQIATPVFAQLLAGPLHFLGLDMYSRPWDHLQFRSRILKRARALSNSFAEVVTARMLRIIPGYSIAGLLNTELRTKYRDLLLFMHHSSRAGTSSSSSY